MGQHTLRISIQESAHKVEVTLEGRLAGPWVGELERTWRQSRERLCGRQLQLDLRNVTYSDFEGKRLLREIFQETRAAIKTSSQWSQYLAEEVRNGNSEREKEEV